MTNTENSQKVILVEGLPIKAFYYLEYMRYRSHLMGLGINPLKGFKEQKEEKPTLPTEITTLKLLNVNYIRFGNCARQRAKYPFTNNSKTLTHNGKYPEKKPYTLENLKIPNKKQLNVKFRCALCPKTVYRQYKPNYRNRQTLRKTPICRHTQILGTQQTPIYAKRRIKGTNTLKPHKIGYFGNTYHIRSLNLTRTTNQKMYIANIKTTKPKR